MTGLLGDDYLNGGPGGDAMDGGPNEDRLYGTDGDDYLIGGDGLTDKCSGGLGFDEVGAGCETITGVP